MINTEITLSDFNSDEPANLSEIYTRCSEAIESKSLELRKNPEYGLFVLFEGYAIGISVNNDDMIELSYLGKHLMN